MPASQAPHQRTVTNGDFDLAVFEYGDPTAETVVLVHGWPDTHHLWDRVIPLLAQRFHVVAYDTRGHGASTRTQRTTDFRLEELSRDFYAVIDAVSPDKPVHVLAHDWGSVQVWEAVCEPQAAERVASFTSVSGPNLDHLASWVRARFSRPTPRNVWQPLTQLASSAYTFFFMTPRLPRATFNAIGTEKVWQRAVALMNDTSPSNVTLGPTFRQDMVDGLLIYRANIVQRMLSPRERHTTVPVQLIVAERDVAVRPAGYDDSAKWTDRLWRRDVAAGHWMPFSHPELLATATTELIDALNGDGIARGLAKSEIGRSAKEFANTLVVITGAGSGIGRETALEFARLGAEVVLSDVNELAAKETAELVDAAGGVAHAYALDVADEVAINEHAAEVIAAYGVPDVVINNAGVGQAGAFLDTTSAEFDRVLRINLGGVVNGCRAFAGPMAERGLGGHIVNLSSMAAYSPQRDMAAYATSKSAVFMFSDCLRAELAERGISVSTICPGIVHTNIVATTQISGVSAEQEAATQAKFDKLYERRGYTPDRVAKRIVDAVRHGRDIVPVTPESWVQYRVNRLAPGAVRMAARRMKLI
ncbi:SDR family oxidoreductase [Nocardia camponoti]|uniref:Oxidoreductase EphD n=1 Tax=Nocardia camponoti TaxID=1616106 RepID=A0A917QPN1_9NOCA|nr:SDR family oxidoreductase [Nocardia camponoti]GGK62060.1 putative oxidoreductase EphD [Nocardia camponoti]